MSGGAVIPWKFAGADVQIVPASGQISVTIQPLPDAQKLPSFSYTAHAVSSTGLSAQLTQVVSNPASPTTIVLTGLTNGIGYNLNLAANLSHSSLADVFPGYALVPG